MNALDLRNDSPKVAAYKLYGYIYGLSKKMGQDTKIEVRMLSPEKNVWQVTWEGGPFAEVVSLSRDGSLFAPESNDYAGEWTAVDYNGNVIGKLTISEE